MKKIRGTWFGLLAAAAAGALVAPSLAHAQNWKPDRPVTIIVPWAPGGSTDQVTRVTATEFEKALGQKVVIVNQPGGSGSIGTKSALDAAKDGCTWTAGAAQDLGAYETLGMLQTKIQDWHLFPNVANVQLVSVNPNTPYKTIGDLLATANTSGGAVLCWNGSAWSVVGGLTGWLNKACETTNGDLFAVGPAASLLGARIDNVARWVGNMKKLKTWNSINEVFHGLVNSTKDKQFETV